MAMLRSLTTAAAFPRAFEHMFHLHGIESNTSSPCHVFVYGPFVGANCHGEIHCNYVIGLPLLQRPINQPSRRNHPAVHPLIWFAMPEPATLGVLKRASRAVDISQCDFRINASRRRIDDF